MCREKSFCLADILKCKAAAKATTKYTAKISQVAAAGRFSSWIVVRSRARVFRLSFDLKRFENTKSPTCN